MCGMHARGTLFMNGGAYAFSRSPAFQKGARRNAAQPKLGRRQTADGSGATLARHYRERRYETRDVKE